MIRKNELKACTNEVHKNKAATATRNTIYYDDKGNEHEHLESPRAYKIYNKGVFDCFAKVTTFNNLWSDKPDFVRQAKQQARLLGVGEFKIMKITREAFDHYITYLKSGNAHYLSLAERSLI